MTEPAAGAEAEVEAQGEIEATKTEAQGEIEATKTEAPAEARATDGSEGESTPGGEPSPSTDVDGPDLLSELEREGEVAADYLEEFLDICDLDGDLDLDVEGERALVAVVGQGLDNLVGRHGEVLDALQELTRLAVLAGTGRRSRLMLDVAGYRARRREELTEKGTAAARQVVETGEPQRMAPMTPFERKVVHDAVSAVDGAHSESEGEEPQRRVVVLRG